MSEEIPKKLNETPTIVPYYLAQQVVRAAAAAASKVFQESPPEEAQRNRLIVCSTCPHFEKSKNRPEEPNRIDGFCGACGCPKSKFSLLSYKAGIKMATCPKNLWDIPKP